MNTLFLYHNWKSSIRLKAHRTGGSTENKGGKVSLYEVSATISRRARGFGTPFD
jgi:hypothetical protein